MSIQTHIQALKFTIKQLIFLLSLVMFHVVSCYEILQIRWTIITKIIIITWFVPRQKIPKIGKETKVEIQYCMTIEYNLSWYPILACYLSQPSHVHNQTFGTYVSSQFTNHFSEGYTPYQIDLKIILKTSKTMMINIMYILSVYINSIIKKWGIYDFITM